MSSGWLLDLYADANEGVVVWILGEDGKRHKLHQTFPVTFFASGVHDQLRELWKHLRANKDPVALARTQRENSAGKLLDVMKITVHNPAYQPRLLNRLIRRFPDLEFYDTDIPLTLRYSAANLVFPFARSEFEVDSTGKLLNIQAIDSRWNPDPVMPPFRMLKIRPDTDPFHENPTKIIVVAGKQKTELQLSNDAALLRSLSRTIDNYDPDFIITSFGDTWLFPYLVSLAEKLNFPFNPNRDKDRQPKRMKEHTYVQYGRVMHRGQQTHLFGRFHIDRHNAMTYGEYGIPGAIKQSRVTGVPIQEMARKSPGAGITAMFMLTSLKRGSIYPHVKQHVEQPKDLLQLDLADNGGLVYKPLIGLHTNVVQIDFSSMYPSIMTLWNVSPETVGVVSDIVKKVPDLELPINQEREGLVAETLGPLLKLRLELKQHLEHLDPDSFEHKRTQAESTALKWLLVVCFGYQGYKRFREGRIEAHETVTAISRRILLKSKELAEQSNFEVLHMYVDGMWIRRSDGRRPSDREIRRLLRRIEEMSGLPITIEADYKWVAFLPSRRDPADPVPNRYFGALRPDGFKVRGISSRRHDTPKFVSIAEKEALEAMAEIDPMEGGAMEAAVVGVLQERVRAFKDKEYPIEEFVVRINISREISQYKVNTAAVRAGKQLESEGRRIRPGQRVRFVYANTEDKVMAWDLADPPTLDDLDQARYVELLLRMGSDLVQPFGMSEEDLRLMVEANAKAVQFSILQ